MNWWTYSAADKFHQVIQNYNVVAIPVGHQGGGVDNKWRGYNWISSNGELVVCRIKDGTFTAINRSAEGWGKSMRKKIFPSWSDSGLPAVVNNGDWATQVSSTAATLSARLVYQAESPTEITLHWGSADGGDQPGKWDNSKPLGVQQPGAAATAGISGLSPRTTYFYRASARNAKGTVWAGASVPFQTAGTLPSPWQQSFVGYPQRPGSRAHFSEGTITVSGSGRDIAEGREPIDNCQFAWQELIGDGELIARITTSEVKTIFHAADFSAVLRGKMVEWQFTLPHAGSTDLPVTRITVGCGGFSLAAPPFSHPPVRLGQAWRCGDSPNGCSRSLPPKANS